MTVTLLVGFHQMFCFSPDPTCLWRLSEAAVLEPNQIVGRWWRADLSAECDVIGRVCIWKDVSVCQESGARYDNCRALDAGEREPLVASVAVTKAANAFDLAQLPPALLPENYVVARLRR